MYKRQHLGDEAKYVLQRPEEEEEEGLRSDTDGHGVVASRTTPRHLRGFGVRTVARKGFSGAGGSERPGKDHPSNG